MTTEPAVKSHEEYMAVALEEARAAMACGEVPVGAVIVKNGEVLAAAHNLREESGDATAHAEVLAIRRACEILGGWNLHDCTLYVTLEPCPMCAGAVINARIGKVVFGAYDGRAGSFGSLVNLSAYPYNHRPIIEGGVCEEESRALLQTFFASLRGQGKARNEVPPAEGGQDHTNR